MKKIILVLGLLLMTLVINAQVSLENISRFQREKIDFFSGANTFIIEFEIEDRPYDYNEERLMYDLQRGLNLAGVSSWLHPRMVRFTPRKSQ